MHWSDNNCEMTKCIGWRRRFCLDCSSKKQLRTNPNSVVLHTSERCRTNVPSRCCFVVGSFFLLLLLLYDRSEKMSWRSSRTALRKVGTYSYYCLISQFFFRIGGSRIIWFVAAAAVVLVVSSKPKDPLQPQLCTAFMWRISYLRIF